MTSLVILAAGLGSRFGGNKQLAEFGQLQLTLMEYNLINAVNAGFNHVVFIIRPELEALLRQQVIARLPTGLDYAIAFQTLDDLPQGCAISELRTKPLGTAHALWCSRHVVDSSFSVINADDFYGKQAFLLLLAQAIKTPNHYLMVAYQVQNTLSEFGGVNRGLCQFDEHNDLITIEECEQIKVHNQGISGILSANQQAVELAAQSLISMNCWFFTTDIFSAIEGSLKALLLDIDSKAIDINKECYLPAVVMAQIQQENKAVKVLSTDEHWFGLTYPQDIEQVNKKVTALFPKR